MSAVTSPTFPAGHYGNAWWQRVLDDEYWAQTLLAGVDPVTVTIAKCVRQSPFVCRHCGAVRVDGVFYECLRLKLDSGWLNVGAYIDAGLRALYRLPARDWGAA